MIDILWCQVGKIIETSRISCRYYRQKWMLADSEIYDARFTLFGTHILDVPASQSSFSLRDLNPVTFASNAIVLYTWLPCQIRMNYHTDSPKKFISIIIHHDYKQNKRLKLTFFTH